MKEKLFPSINWSSCSYVRNNIINLIIFFWFQIEPEIQNAAEDETAVFECIADGEPRPTIQWIHNGAPIEIGNKEQANRIVDLNRITIGNLQKKDTGNYGCNATNKIGYVYKDAYVNVLSLPPDIQVILMIHDIV